MIQCYFIVVLIVYSASLIVESTPIREDTRIRQLDPTPPRKPAKPPFLPDPTSPSRRTIQWLLLFLQVILLGILAGLIISVMSVDKIHLRIWMNTGGEKQRKFAKRILMVRDRPNWLLVTLIITSVLIAQALPISLSYMMPSISTWMTFFLSTTAITLIGEILPQAVVPLWILEIGGRSVWFLRVLMWVLAIPAFLPACALRIARQWRGKKHADRRDGVLDLDELVEFVKLHQISCDLNGPLTDECGSLVRAVLSSQQQTILDDVKPWMYLTYLDVNAELDATVLENIWDSNDPYIMLVKNTVTEVGSCSGQEENLDVGDNPLQQVSGNGFLRYNILLRRDFIISSLEQKAIKFGDLPLRRVPIVQATCKIHRLISFLTTVRQPCAIVVAPLNPLPSGNLVDITQHLQNLEDSVDQRLRVLGFVDYQDLVARVLCGETMTQDTKDGEQPQSTIVTGVPTPPSTPSSPLPSSRPLPFPAPSESRNESTTEHHGEEFNAEGIRDPPPGPSTSPTRFLSHSRPFTVPNNPKNEGLSQDLTRQDSPNHSEFQPEGIGDPPPPPPQQQQRSVSLDALMVTLPEVSEEEIRSGRSTSELRRRRRPRLRASIFQIFRPDDAASLDFREKRGEV